MEESIKLTLYLSVLNHVLILSLLSSLIYVSMEAINTETHRNTQTDAVTGAAERKSLVPHDPPGGVLPPRCV